MTDERGQVLPLLIVVMIMLIGAGMLTLYLGFSAGTATEAQTAADAAALAGEQSVVEQLRTPHYGPDGELLPPTYDPQVACQKAQSYATDNDASLSCSDVQFIPVSGTFGTDVEVTVHSLRTVPNGSPADAGSGATASARASTDPFSQDSPPISTTMISCDASVVSGDPFKPPTDKGGNDPGFFAKTDTNYTFGCEPKLAGKLQALAVAENLHLVGDQGYDTSTATNATGSADQIEAAHACGAASKTGGLPKDLTDQTLKSFGLSRPFTGATDEIELDGTAGCTQQTSTAPGTSQPIGFGNSDVHLVPLNGGPVGSGLTLALSGPTAPASESQIQLGCQIWSIGNSLHVDQKVMLSAFLGAWDESTMSNITTYTPGEGESLGMFQQQADDGWGTPAQETNPPDAIKMYFGGDEIGSSYYTGNGSSAGAIADDAANPDFLPWQLTQKVQSSIDGSGSNYEAQLGPATTMINQIKAGACNNH